MRALVLLSGGLDSTVATWWALEQGYDVAALTFHYHKRPPPEIEATRAIADQAGVDLVEVEMPWLQELEDPRHPLLDNEELEATFPEGYVPARNAIFYAIGAHHAEIMGMDRLVGGHNGADPDRFPDVRPRFFDELETLLDQGLVTRPGLEIEQPLLGSSKAEVVEKGQALGAPLSLAWSCYEEGPEPCGECPSCTARRDAFEANGLTDPVLA